MPKTKGFFCAGGCVEIDVMDNRIGCGGLVEMARDMLKQALVLLKWCPKFHSVR